MYPAGVTGCNKLAFNPSLKVTPDTSEANSPSGYGVDLHVPQSIAPNDLASPALDNAVVTLPQGVAINPGAADGLQACTDNGGEPPGSLGNEIGLGSDAQPTCPHASQVGTVELTTPLLPDILHGEVYLASDHSANNYAVFVVIRGDGSAGEVEGECGSEPGDGPVDGELLEQPAVPVHRFRVALLWWPPGGVGEPERVWSCDDDDGSDAVVCRPRWYRGRDAVEHVRGEL